MPALRPGRVAVLLGLVVLLGTLARIPGLFWGYNFFGTEAVILHPDEPPYSFGRSPGTAYPRGLSTQVNLVATLLHRMGPTGLLQWVDWNFFGGRILTLLYGVLTLVVVFRLGRSLFRDERVGLLAALFLALADLHVTYSHIGIPDTPATFWYYAALASASTALTSGSPRAAVLSAVCTGAVVAMRFQVTSLIPLVWWVARSRRRVASALALLATVSASFLLFNGLGFNPVGTWRFLTSIAVWGDLGWKKVFLPLVYLGVLVVGVGLPVFALAAYGLVRFVRTKWTAVRDWRDLLADHEIPLVLAPLAAFLQLATVGLWAHRHAVVLVPFVAILAAYGFASLPRFALGPLSAPLVTRGLLVAIGVYLAVQVASVQAYFVDDPLEKAGRWLRARVPAGEVLSKEPSAKVPPEYPTIDEWKANYLVVSARGYRRYLFRDFLPAHLTGRFVTPEDVAALTVFGGDATDAVRFQQLFRGELPYRLARRFRLQFYTPELLLTEAFWYPPPHLNEVLIYERRREPEKTFALLTAARTDYLVTLDMGREWRLEADQEVRILVNGRQLDAVIREGDTHLFVPRALVTSPHSELRLASTRPLPHLPVGAVKRVRPLGPELTVDALLDGDLMAEGFHPPEVRADGATSRWSQAAGRVLLPGPGSGGAWKRLAVRLRGRPSDGRPPQPVVLFMDGRKLGEATVAGEDQTLEFPIPDGVLVGELSSLQLVTLPWRPAEAPGAGDTRELGVAVYWLRLSRAERFRPLGDAVEAVSFPSGGLRLRADLFAPKNGGRSAILLAHGASPKGRKHGLYVGLARRLAERGYWVLSPDFRGYGESDDPPRITTAGDLDFAQDLVAALGFLETRLGVRDVTVVGHSFGAGVALAAAARDPRVGKVVAISPGRRAHQRILGSAEGRLTIRERMLFEMGLRAEQFPPELVAPVVVPIIIDTYVEHPFRQPVFLIDGEREEPADLRFLRDVARRMKGRVAYVTIPNADHYFGIERQAEDRDPVTLSSLADVIDGWIREGAGWSATVAPAPSQ